MKLQFYFFAFAFLLGATTARSQSASVPKIEDLVKIPASPEAQAFAKYGNTPVNMYSDSPEINIPVYTIQGHEISIPITLNYDHQRIRS
jgi:hypothetical protein